MVERAAEQLVNRIRIIWFFAIAPLAFGSLVFVYWYCARTFFAKDADVLGVAMVAVLSFVLAGIILILLSFGYIRRSPTERRKLVFPLLMLPLTILAIKVYSDYYEAMTGRAYIAIDNGQPYARRFWIWSDHFEFIVYCDEDIRDIDRVISFQPVYTYDWAKPTSVGHPYSIDTVYITLDLGNDSIPSFRLPDIPKGACLQLSMSEIMAMPRVERERATLSR